MVYLSFNNQYLKKIQKSQRKPYPTTHHQAKKSNKKVKQRQLFYLAISYCLIIFFLIHFLELMNIGTSFYISTRTPSETMMGWQLVCATRSNLARSRRWSGSKRCLSERTFSPAALLRVCSHAAAAAAAAAAVVVASGTSQSVHLHGSLGSVLCKEALICKEGEGR